MTAAPTRGEAYAKRPLRTMTMAAALESVATPLASRDGVRAWMLLSVVTAAATALVLSSPDPWPVAVLLLVAPITEETVLRAGLQEWLMRRRLSMGVCIGATACAFVLAHVVLRGPSLFSLAVAGPALFIGWVYMHHRMLRSCIAWHMAMNVTWFVTSPWLLPRYWAF